MDSQFWAGSLSIVTKENISENGFVSPQQWGAGSRSPTLIKTRDIEKKVDAVYSTTSLNRNSKGIKDTVKCTQTLQQGILYTRCIQSLLPAFSVRRPRRREHFKKVAYGGIEAQSAVAERTGSRKFSSNNFLFFFYIKMHVWRGSERGRRNAFSTHT